jgi:uncharacterized membrane protein
VRLILTPKGNRNKGSRVPLVKRESEDVFFFYFLDSAVRRTLRSFCFLLGLALWLACTAAQAANPAVGDRVSGHIVLGAKQIPLPAGEWVMAGRGNQAFTMPSLGAFGAIETAILFRVLDGHIRAVIEINSNAIPVNDGWGRTAACKAEQPPFLLITRYSTGWETSCLFVQPTFFGAASPGPKAWEQAREFANQANLAMPETWITAGFRVSDRQDLVDARYHFDPTLMLGFAGASFRHPADWSADIVDKDPLRRGAVEIVSSWAAGFDAWVERGLRNQIDAAPGPMPEVAAYEMLAPYVDAKLRDLDSLYREDRIAPESYLAQSANATTEVPVFQQRTSLLSNSVKKNISFRSFGTFVDYGIAYLVTASSAVSWGIALTLNATDSVWFVLNDQYWDRHYARLNTHDSERLVDFVYLGDGAAAPAAGMAASR